MEQSFYEHLTQTSLNGDALSKEECQRTLTDTTLDTMDLIHAAYKVRRTYFGKEVMLHTINNAQNGHCPEDCSYCAQAKTSKADIDKYPIKSKDEILEEARLAYEAGAFRYCMVFAGRGPNERRIDQLSDLIREIKSRYPIQVCVSAGLVNDAGAKSLKAAGLDRLNHNLNTSKERYKTICSTHTYDDRLNTLMAAKNNNLEICSGIIAGMGESADELIELAFTLRGLNSPSIPINYFLPIEGTILTNRAPKNLTPEYCLRILCLFRFLNPKAELRVAAGREIHFRTQQALLFYVANSIFTDGYLNTKGTTVLQTLEMLEDGGFTINSDVPIEDIRARYGNGASKAAVSQTSQVEMKKLKDLKPTCASC